MPSHPCSSHRPQTSRGGTPLSSGAQLALEAAALVVLGGDEALPGGTQVDQASLEVGGEADVLEDQTGLVGEVVHELDLDGGDLLAAALGDGEGAEHLALVAHLHRAVGGRN